MTYGSINNAGNAPRDSVTLQQPLFTSSGALEAPKEKIGQLL